ncbi:hypothetical protein AX14_011772 [Amanita brunnescens Koide BX004]|nr:hypothetical protein AX14_011772 [Amanita brunnescens Koide BX004]
MPPVPSFAIFQDSPIIEEAPAPKQSKPALPLKRTTRSSSSKSENVLCVDSAPITAPDKENFHPVTGEHAGLGTADKKRKDGSNVLVTKLHNPPRPLAVKKHKKELSVALKDEGSPTKKRKASAPSDPIVVVGSHLKVPKTKTVTATKKESKATAKPRKLITTKRITTRPRTLSALPKVAEEETIGDELKDGRGEAKAKKQSQLSQADIDSRCYELTVKPLADVSQAYEETLIFQDVNPREDKSKYQPVKEPSAEPELRDFYAPPVASSTSSQLGSSRKSPFEEPTGSSKTFTTPERKAIYAAFTFSSPSPSGDRLSKTTRAGSIPRLEFA